MFNRTLSPSSSFHNSYGCIYYCFHELCHGKTELDGWFGRLKIFLDNLRLNNYMSSTTDVTHQLSKLCEENVNNSHQRYEFVMYVNFIFLNFITNYFFFILKRRTAKYVLRTVIHKNFT
jgi:hypothetical protein